MATRKHDPKPLADCEMQELIDKAFHEVRILLTLIAHQLISASIGRDLRRRY